MVGIVVTGQIISWRVLLLSPQKVLITRSHQVKDDIRLAITSENMVTNLRIVGFSRIHHVLFVGSVDGCISVIIMNGETSSSNVVN